MGIEIDLETDGDKITWEQLQDPNNIAKVMQMFKSILADDVVPTLVFTHQEDDGVSVRVGTLLPFDLTQYYLQAAAKVCGKAAADMN